MKKNLLLIPLFLCLQLHAFSQSETISSLQDKANKLSKNFMDWLVYEAENIFLYSTYATYNADLTSIDKKTFLTALSSGKFMPIRLENKSMLSYATIPMTDSIDPDVKTTIQARSTQCLKYTKMEGSVLPAFELYDIQGKKYSNESIKGKFVIINCWYISCVPCVKEIPELNELVKKYKKREDILFLAVGFDGKNEMIDFNKQRKFNYNLIYNGESYLRYIVGIESYPTHVVIQPDGTIAKIVPGDVKYIIPLIKESMK